MIGRSIAFSVISMTLSGCAAFVAAVGSSATAMSAAHAGAAVLAAPATPVVLGTGAAVVGSAYGDASGVDALIGMSRANAETCAGFHNRTSEITGAGMERWTYERNSCRVALAFKDGYVSEVSYPNGSDCGVLQMCRARSR
jgi:hypothetical protein